MKNSKMGEDIPISIINEYMEISILIKNKRRPAIPIDLAFDPYGRVGQFLYFDITHTYL